MTLASLIQTIPDWQNKTPQELHAELSAPSVLVEDHELYTWAGVALVCGDDGASALCSKLIEFGKLWAVHQLGGRGLDMASDEVQQQLYYLDSIGVPNMAKLAQAVKRSISLLEQSGIEATVEEVAIAQRKRQLEDAATDRLQAYREALSAWDGSVETEPVL
jgi:hypothetical protein